MNAVRGRSVPACCDRPVLMRAVVQRVLRAGVDSSLSDRPDRPSGGTQRWERVGEVGLGMCVLVGVTHDDTEEHALRLAEKLIGLRIFDDADGVMNLDLLSAAEAAASAVAPDRDSAAGSGAGQQVPSSGQLSPQVASLAPGVLVVSQFTLYGDTSKGRRPSWVDAARPDVAEPLVDAVVTRLRELTAETPLHVATGRFRTEMRVDIVNDGPVTLIVEV
jgi:D-tyrosyl-tRNA(Tyr) deacylase